MNDTERLNMILQLNTVLCKQIECGISNSRYGGEESLKKAIDRLADGIGIPNAAPPVDGPPF